MSIGERIGRLKKDKGLSNVKLAQKAQISNSFLGDIEKGRRNPSMEVLKNLANALDTTVAYLIGETDNPDPNILDKLPFADNQKIKILHYTDWIEIPVLEPTSIACAGFGNGGMDGIVAEATRFIALPADELGPIGEHKPFAIIVEGDSMEDAGIFSGSEVAVNPESEVFDGDVALVCFGIKNELAVKWVYFHRDGSVEIKSANPKYPPRSFTKEDIENDWFKIIGKVMRTSQTPKRGI